MTLRFEVNQAEAFRQGVNVEKSTNHLDVNPVELSQEERNLIADRLAGIDVCKLKVEYDGTVVKEHRRFEEDVSHRIAAKLPTYEGLIEAIRQNQAEVEQDLKAKSPKTP